MLQDDLIPSPGSAIRFGRHRHHLKHAWGCTRHDRAAVKFPKLSQLSFTARCSGLPSASASASASSKFLQYARSSHRDQVAPRFVSMPFFCPIMRLWPYPVMKAYDSTDSAVACSQTHLAWIDGLYISRHLGNSSWESPNMRIVLYCSVYTVR